MKKYYIYAAFCAIITLESVAQQRSCVYTHPTSTNPNDPFNLEYLGYSGSSVNNFENSFFNWYPNSNNAIYIDPSINWVIPQFQNSTPNHYYSMIWPWDANTIPSEFSYLSLIWNPNIGINGGHEPLLPEERDFRWEDGWELLWMNLGYYPNGIKNDRNRIINVHRI